VFPASRPSRGGVSCVALGLPGQPPKGAVPRYPHRGVLRDWSRPVPGSCREVVSPLTGGFPHRWRIKDAHIHRRTKNEDEKRMQRRKESEHGPQRVIAKQHTRTPFSIPQHTQHPREVRRLWPHTLNEVVSLCDLRPTDRCADERRLPALFTRSFHGPPPGTAPGCNGQSETKEACATAKSYPVPATGGKTNAGQLWSATAW